MDKNQVIGIVLIIAVMAGYYLFFAPDPAAPAEPTASEQTQVVPEVDQQQEQIESQLQPLEMDSASVAQHDAQSITKYGVFAGAAKGTEEFVTISNKHMNVQISTAGGMLESVQLPEYHTFWDSLPIFLWDPESSNMAIGFTYLGKGVMNTSDFFFTPTTTRQVATENAPAQVTMRLTTDDRNKYLEFTYTLAYDSDLVTFDLKANGLDGLIDLNTQRPTFNWHAEGFHAEKGIDLERQRSSVFYRYEDKDRDYLTERTDDEEELDEELHWMCFKQSYFSAMIVSDEGFPAGGRIASAPPALETDTVHSMIYDANLILPLAQSSSANTNLQFYFGPNQYNRLKNTGIDEAVHVIDYGWWIFGWVNRNMIRPVFNWLTSFISSAGLVIIILTLMIKLLLFPVTWKNYASSAKMRVLKPEIDEINKKFEGKPAAEKQQATMALYRQTGVNPFAGCLPMLLQIPILYAMFRFFPSSFELRGKSFLWADDLGAYDAVISWSQQIPLVSEFYGNHVSGFTVLMAASTFFYTRMSTANMPTQNQPGMPNMKVIMNIFPFMMLIFFNKFAAGLSFYYLMANLISIAQMYSIKRWFIDEDKIRAKIESNKKKPKKKGGLQARLEEAQKMQAAQKKKK